MTATRIQVPQGTVIFKEGDSPDSAYLIDSGQVEISTSRARGSVVLCQLGPGDLLGEMAVIDDAPRTATARALTALVLTEIRRDQILERLEQTDPVIRLLLLGLLQRYRSGLDAVRGRSASLPGLVEPARLELEKFRLESQLREALETASLEVLFQPIAEVRNGRIAGFEALVRWNHPERGPISPGEFIALAEETNLIVPVGEYVLQQVCLALNRFNSGALEPVFVAVNVSGRQLRAANFVERLCAIVAAAGSDPNHLKIEITESLTIDSDLVATLILDLQQKGIRVALDDFGTGHSSLARLHQLDVDIIKLDQAFVRQMPGEPRCHAIVAAVVGMGKALGCDFVAEGVETALHLELIGALGCRFAQGYHIGRPMDLDAALRLLSR